MEPVPRGGAGDRREAGPFERRAVLAFFPTFVWLHDLEPADRERLNPALAPLVERLVQERGAQTAGRAAQTRNDLQHRPELDPLLTLVKEAAKQALDSLHADYRELVVTGCWGNLSRPGDSHHEHSHPNNYLSGVYYVRTAPGGDSISFADPRPQAHVIAPRLTKPSPETASTVTLEARAGRLLLFPGWLRHFVGVNGAAADRISISFNLMFDDFVESTSRPRW